jgi:hypothetical protein
MIIASLGLVVQSSCGGTDSSMQNGPVGSTTQQPARPDHCRYLASLASVDSLVKRDSTIVYRLNDCRRRDGIVAKLAAQGRELIKIHWEIPEYHDEQPLRDGPTKFGPLAYFYALPQIATYTDSSQIDGQSPRGALVGVVVIEAPASGAALPDTYENLHLQVGVNCVWLAHNPNATDGRWKGYVGPATADTLCDRDTPLTNPSWLKVQRRVEPRYTGAKDYAPVARFSEAESPGGQALLGVKCLDAWCEIGPQGFVPHPSVMPNELERYPGTSIAEDRKESKIKGWFDEQRLAVMKNGEYEPNVRARITPLPGLEKLTPGDFATWKPVAAIFLFGNPSPETKYYAWGLRDGDNTLEIRLTGGTWEAQLAAKGERPAKLWKLVQRYPHYDEAVPATARFRWAQNDDGFWIPCAQGCCEVEGPQ